METKNLNKKLSEIFQGKYIIPLYQRNYAWEHDEISQLLQDLYENFKKHREVRELNYFIGSLVVLKRKDGLYEVIDGQQRLTTLSLLLKILNVDFIKESQLSYESRPEVEAFFDNYYRTGRTNEITFDHKVSHLVNAVDLMQQCIINPDEPVPIRILEIKDLDAFRNFVINNVILVRVEIPEDTDVASYFEIMNNRGEQLQKHEILKSYLMDMIKDAHGNHLAVQQNLFSKIWDACSQMDTHIQKLFHTEDRGKFFGNDYNEYVGINEKNNNINSKDRSFSIEEALSEGVINLGKNTKQDYNIDDEGNDQSIIDFPNFLMHIFKLEYSTYTQNDKEVELPLNEKDLILVYDGLKSKINVMKFINALLYYRTVFDRYIIKSSNDDKEEDNYKWSLMQPYIYVYERKGTKSVKYKNSFDNHQERLVKSLSLLQVTFRNRKYKNWLQEMLFIFKEKNNFGISPKFYQDRIDNWILNYFDKNISSIDYNNGVKVPHFLFNFIDYLYWVETLNHIDEKKFNFNFKYRNSVEHHLPQSYKENEDHKDMLGNLCLVSKSSNSKMNNESPVGKADIKGKYYKTNLPPKQKTMYDETNLKSAWGRDQIEKHSNDAELMLERRKEILFLGDLSLAMRVAILNP